MRALWMVGVVGGEKHEGCTDICINGELVKSAYCSQSARTYMIPLALNLSNMRARRKFMAGGIDGPAVWEVHRGCGKPRLLDLGPFFSSLSFLPRTWFTRIQYVTLKWNAWFNSDLSPGSSIDSRVGHGGDEILGSGYGRILLSPGEHNSFHVTTEALQSWYVCRVGVV
ncbi:hypothetical protein P154DRAFT_168767 [Amniculicola lignicola CBS 123094]|uniref:Uncharacterized protein n=1 Tax=Amniculicola lignicola CBS 123094 TaxID=1392246 RepID=A0A6A5WQK6_9PLEO|nr:hypothetical protein P154DRAFT_168767 [Amniculicola lignicola CBS 123094]